MCHPLHFIRGVMQTWGGNFCRASCEQLHVSSKSRAVKHKALRFLCRSGNGPGRARVICYRSGIWWEYRCIPLTFDHDHVDYFYPSSPSVMEKQIQAALTWLLELFQIKNEWVQRYMNVMTATGGCRITVSVNPTWLDTPAVGSPKSALG